MPDNFLDIPDRGRRTLHITKMIVNFRQHTACLFKTLKKVEIKDNACEYMYMMYGYTCSDKLLTIPRSKDNSTSIRTDQSVFLQSVLQ